MMRRAAGLALLLSLWGFALRADEPAGAKELLALEAAFQTLIKTTEPAVACILVSRSNAYQETFKQPYSADQPGNLGTFDARQFPSRFNGLQPDAKAELAHRLDLSDPGNVPDAFGSGVVIDEKDRLILTNYHVIKDATKIYVRLPGDRGGYANIHAADGRADLAVLQLINPVPRLQAVRLGDGRTVQKGQLVLALANPYAAGFRDGSPSASWGVIANLRRRSATAGSEVDRAKMTLPQFCTLLQTDVRLNLGCSGGALFNLKGEMIGLTTALAAVSGLDTPGGFALPMDPNIKAIIDVLKRGEEVEYGFLGISMSGETRRTNEGYTIRAPIDNSPAEKAGLQDGNVVVSINDVRVKDGDELYFHIGTALAGGSAKLEIARFAGGPTEARTVKLAKAFVDTPRIVTKKINPRTFGGLRVDYSSVLFQRGGGPALRRMPDGVAIREVVPGSAADKARLQVDKLITRVNDRLIHTPADFYREMSAAKGPVELTVTTSDDRTGERVRLDLN